MTGPGRPDQTGAGPEASELRFSGQHVGLVPLGLEQGHGVPDGRPGDAEVQGQLPLGRQPRALAPAVSLRLGQDQRRQRPALERRVVAVHLIPLIKPIQPIARATRLSHHLAAMSRIDLMCCKCL